MRGEGQPLCLRVWAACMAGCAIMWRLCGMVKWLDGKMAGDRLTLVLKSVLR